MQHEYPGALVRVLVLALGESASDVTEGAELFRLPDKWLQILPSDESLSQSVSGPGSEGSGDTYSFDTDRPVPPGTESWCLKMGQSGSRYFIIAPVESLKLSSGDAANALMAAVRLRSRLSDEARTDLYLLFVAPPGANVDAAWRRAAKQMELNEAFCRIFVWLPVSSVADWPGEARKFSQRLFLTRLPIAGGHRSDIAPLSALFAVLPLKPETRSVWEELLLQNSDVSNRLSNKAIAEGLVDSIDAMETSKDE